MIKVLRFRFKHWGIRVSGSGLGSPFHAGRLQGPDELPKISILRSSSGNLCHNHIRNLRP